MLLRATGQGVVRGPGDEPWEMYVVKGDSDSLDKVTGSACCTEDRAADKQPL